MTTSIPFDTHPDKVRNTATRFFEGFEGQRFEYSWVAEVSREATPQGLDGGRIISLSVTRDIVMPAPAAPGPHYGGASFQTTSKQVHTRQVARFENGELTCDREARAVVDRLKGAFTDERVKVWGPAFGIADKNEPSPSRPRDQSRTRDDFERAR